MKKILILTLALVAIFSTLCFASAAKVGVAEESAELLYDLGLFKGTGTDASGEPVFELNRAPNRYEAVTMLVRLLGKEAEALAGDYGDLPFIDITQEWARPYIGYAYENGLTNGVDATPGAERYGGEQLVTASQYITFVLRAMGYESGVDFEWSAAWELSDVLGITKGDYDEKTTTFLRGDVAIISEGALGAYPKTGDEKLLDILPIEKIQLTGAQFQNPVAYYGLEYYDLNEGNVSPDWAEQISSSNGYGSARFYVESLPDDFFDEFVEDVSELNPNFEFVGYDETDYRSNTTYRSYTRTASFKYSPSDGSPELATISDYYDSHFIIEYTWRNSNETYTTYPHNRCYIEFRWVDGVELVDTGVRADYIPTLQATSSVGLIVDAQPDTRAKISGAKIVDPESYYNLVGQLASDEVKTYWVGEGDNKEFVFIQAVHRDFVQEYVGDLLAANPDLELVQVILNDYTTSGNDRWHEYRFRVNSLGDEKFDENGNLTAHFTLSFRRGLYGECYIWWKWDERVELVDVGYRATVQPTPLYSSTGKIEDVDGEWIPSSTDSSGRTTIKCPFCDDGKDECSRCDGDGGKYVYSGSTANYSGSIGGSKAVRTWESCSKCHGSGEVDCTRCGGDGEY